MPDFYLVYGIGLELESNYLLMCDYGNIEINTGLGYACAVKYNFKHSAISRAILGC